MDASLLSSDSDDTDYVPPQSSGAGSSAAAPPAGSDTDSAAADAFYAEDAVPDYVESDFERPPNTRGGPSSAGPSRTGGSSAAGSSSRPSVASVAAESSSAAPRPRASSSGNGSANGPVASTDITPAVSAGNVESGTGDKAVLVKDAAANEKLTASENKETAENKKSVDDLWKEMNKPISKPVPTTSSKEVDTSGLNDWLKPSVVPKAAISKVPRLEELENKRAAEEADEIQPAKKPKLGTGLEAVLNAAKGEERSNTLEKTKETWKEFKKDDKEVEEELEAYKKDKNRYTDKVSFLERSSQREWEVEQAGKKKR